MNEFIEKLIDKIENEAFAVQLEKGIKHPSTLDAMMEKFTVFRIKEIVNQLAEEYGKDNNVTTSEYEKGYEDGAESVRAMLPYEEKNVDWIPCSERLPDYLDNVLVCTKSGGRTIAHLKHTPIEWRDMHMNKIDDVIAWKYLDAPYQPKGE